MNITIISNHYYPEDSGIGLYSTGMAEFLAQKHKVTVLAGTPYYPQWKIYPEYQNQGAFGKEFINGVEIFRFKQYTPANPNFIRRIIQMVHFFAGSLVNVFKIKNNDIVIVVMPFTLSVVLGWFVKMISGGKLWVHVQDFEFDAAFETGISNKSGIVKKLIFGIERFILNRANHISTISNGMLKKLATKTDAPQSLFPNWIDHSIINPEQARPSPIFNASKFNILYSGNIGAKQDWEFFMAFVQECQSIPNLHITVIGDGAKGKELVNSIKVFQNVTYFPPVRYDEMNDLLCTADLHILFQKDTVIDTVMPSKILGMMASAKPSIVTGDQNSEVKYNFESSQGGFYFYEADKMKKIIQTVKRLVENPNESKMTGTNARKFVKDNYAIETVLSHFENELLLFQNQSKEK